MMITGKNLFNPSDRDIRSLEVGNYIVWIKVRSKSRRSQYNGLDSEGKNGIKPYPFTEPVKAPETTYRWDNRKIMTTGTIMINPATAASAYWKWMPPGFGLKPGWSAEVLPRTVWIPTGKVKSLSSFN